MTRQSSQQQQEQQQEQQGVVLKRKRTSSFVSHTTRDAASVSVRAASAAAAASSLTLFRKPCQVKKHCLYWLLLVCCTLHSTNAFLTQLSTSTQVGLALPHAPLPSSPSPSYSSSSPSSSPSSSSSRSSSSSWALRVTWFGGTAETEVSNNNNDDSCELVAVRIERTSANSRRILGEIVVEAPLSHVWSILTDYNRLSVHVPNLVESRIVSVHTPDRQPGDGHYRCRLFQKGAQKIVGFEFGASVTMDMAERVNGETSAVYNNNNNSDDSNADEVTTPVSRSIQFKCYDSFFFSEFDGQWKATEQVNPASGQIETVLSYIVDVRPKGPVPVAALEWRIREDVPTNLRAVKSAALLRQQQKLRRTASAAGKGATAAMAPKEQGESLTAYTEKSPVLDATTRRRSGVVNNERGGTAPTPRQQQEQLQAAAARRALRRPAISPFAKAATPPPRKRQEHKTTANQQEQQQKQPHRRMTKIKVDWDDNETLGAYLKGP